jgi:hypothetical protein
MRMERAALVELDALLTTECGHGNVETLGLSSRQGSSC